MTETYLPLLQRYARALRSRNFRLFVIGQLLSLSGSWAQQVAIGWLVYRLTRFGLATTAVAENRFALVDPLTAEQTLLAGLGFGKGERFPDRGPRFLADEVIEGGNNVDDAAFFAVEFAKAGMDFLSLSRGGKFDDAKQPKVGAAAYP